VRLCVVRSVDGESRAARCEFWADIAFARHARTDNMDGSLVVPGDVIADVSTGRGLVAGPGVWARDDGVLVASRSGALSGRA